MPALRSLSCNLRTTVSRSNDAVAEPDCSTVVLSFVTHTHPSKQVDGTPTVHALASRSRITRRPSSPTSPNETIRHKLHDVATAAAMTRRFVPIARDQPRFRRGFTAYGGLRAPGRRWLSPNDAGVSAPHSAKAAASSSRNRRWLAWPAYRLTTFAFMAAAKTVASASLANAQWISARPPARTMVAA